MREPYLVPVMARWSRRTHRRGVSGSASTDMGLPLAFRVIIEELLGKKPRARPDRERGDAARPQWRVPHIVVREVPTPAAAPTADPTTAATDDMTPGCPGAAPTPRDAPPDL